MKLINTNVHGWMDYAMGAIVMGSPWIFNFEKDEVQTKVALISGATVILYSLFTNYEMGILKRNGIPMKTHLVLDALSGILLAASPWIFDFKEDTYLPFVVFGIIEVLAALSTDTTPYARLGANAVKEVDHIG